MKVVKRVMVLGPPGSGKSTLAKRLGTRLDYPVIHLDVHFWKPGWEVPSREDWITTQQELVRSSKRWVMDGNYDGTLEIRLRYADTVIILGMPRWRSLYRVIRRWILYLGEVREDMADGCPEKIDLDFLRYVWAFNDDELPIIEREIEEYDGNVTVFNLDASNPDEIESFLNRAKRPQPELD